MTLARLRSAVATIAFVAAASLSATACHARDAAPAESASDAAFGARVRAYLLSHPEVLNEAFERLQAQQEATKAADLKTAIAARRNLLERDPRDPILGNPKGKVTVVEFFDYRCPFCRAAEPDVETLLAQNPDVRLVLKEFPILDLEDNSHISENASRGALAANAQGRYAQVHRALLARPNLSDADIAPILKAAGVNLAAAVKVEALPATTAQLADARALAHALGVDGTPAFVIGDQMIPGAQMDLVRAAIDKARKAAP